MDNESPRTRELGCWDAPNLLTPSINEWASKASTPDFDPGLGYSDFLIDIGFGKDCSGDVREFWRKTISDNYQGDDGRRRMRMAAINLRDRDGLHARLSDITCPVLWLHVGPYAYICWDVGYGLTYVQGTKDVVYSVPNAQQEIKLFTSSPETELVTVEGGAHFLSASHPKEVDEALIKFVSKHSK